MSKLARDAHKYWRLSSIWNRRITSKKYERFTDVIVDVRELVEQTHSFKVASRGQELYMRVINNQRCRKSKPINNVCSLSTHVGIATDATVTNSNLKATNAQ